MLEREIQRACLEWLHWHRVFCWRQNQGAIPTGNGGYRRFSGLRGVSDILGVLKDGRFLAVEIKAPGGRLRTEQVEFLKNVNQRGGLGICVRSVEELETAIQGSI